MQVFTCKAHFCSVYNQTSWNMGPFQWVYKYKTYIPVASPPAVKFGSLCEPCENIEGENNPAPPYVNPITKSHGCQKNFISPPSQHLHWTMLSVSFGMTKGILISILTKQLWEICNQGEEDMPNVNSWCIQKSIGLYNRVIYWYLWGGLIGKIRHSPTDKTIQLLIPICTIVWSKSTCNSNGVWLE